MSIQLSFPAQVKEEDWINNIEEEVAAVILTPLCCAEPHYETHYELLPQ